MDQDGYILVAWSIDKRRLSGLLRIVASRRGEFLGSIRVKTGIYFHEIQRGCQDPCRLNDTLTE